MQVKPGRVKGLGQIRANPILTLPVRTWESSNRGIAAGMRMRTALFLALAACSATPLAAQVVVYQEVVEEVFEAPATGSNRFVESHGAPAPVAPADIPRGIWPTTARSACSTPRHAALIDATDTRSPGQFTAMLRAYPGIRTLEMLDCPGTDDDRANLRLGLMLRDKGIATHVPRGGSVRSGAVELFLAGARRQADPGSEFAVHSWRDEFGLEPKDYAAEAPENRVYIDYYTMLGMSEQEARAFYAMTNSVRSADAKWMSPEEMGEWVRLDNAPEPTIVASR